MTRVEGACDPRFEPVARAFERGFTEHGDLGAAFAVVHDGRLVVDLWGGVADPASGRRWERDTLQVVFSGTKGLVAACILMLVERGLLALDRPVADWWPEFAAAGKERVLVRDVVSHQARLPGVRAPLAARDLLEPERIAALLAAQPQERDPRAALVYHPLTYGWLCGELVRRVDGRSVGAFFAEEIAAPLGLELWIGLPQEQEARVAALRYAPSWLEGLDALDTSDDLVRTINANPVLFDADDVYWDRREFRAAEIAGAGAIGSARSMARFYGCLARGGELDGVRILRPETIALGARELARGRDELSDVPLAFGVGFQLQTSRRRYGPPAGAFGHDGAGGSVHAAWPAQRLGFSYAMNELRGAVAQDADPRVDGLLEALFDVVAQDGDAVVDDAVDVVAPQRRAPLLDG